MGQINVYFPEDLEKKIRERAEKENKSLSAVIIEITKNELKPRNYPASFWKALQTSAPRDFLNDFVHEKLSAETLTEPESFDSE